MQDVYEYGFEYTGEEFRREWLYRMVRKQRLSTQKLFERETEGGTVRVNFGGQLRGENRTIANLTRANSLFLSACAQNNHPQLKDRQGESRLIPLSDFNLRLRDDIERAYRNGRVGGVPLGNEFYIDLDDSSRSVER
ncbi:MAG: hypothetical protein OXH09_02480 [Gammaproteobacteria bacterium]|nr:hypothetical protein [Gammaproteobacteria bacterium]